MILRKPYAFLIKNFQKINLILLLLSSYVIYKNLSFSGMVDKYISSGYFNPITDSMAIYTPTIFYIAIVAIVLICGALIYLLYYKQKPVIVYGLLILEYIAIAIIFAFSASYFNQTGIQTMDTQTTYAIRDFLFLASLPQYATLVVLLIRSLGLDLKKFGFREDEEYLDIQEEDREEFEVGMEFDIHRVKRIIRNRLRRMKYVVLEHKLTFITLTVIVILASSYYGYQQIFVENRTYWAGQTFRANSYEMTIKKMYFTGRDFAGNTVNGEGRKYIILALDITNVTNSSLTLDTNKFVITATHNYYVPDSTHDYYFTDLGSAYHNQELAPGVTNSILLIYEIRPEDFGSNYTLYYQEVRGGNNIKLRLIHTDLTDLSQYEEIETAYLNDTMEVSFLDNTKKSLSFFNYQLDQEVPYLYTSCYVWDCRVYEGKILSSNYTGNRTILRLNYRGDDSGLTMSNFLTKQAKLIYTINGEKKTVDLTSPLSRDWRGKYVYLLVPSEVKDASEVAFQFVVRDKAYQYFLKGGEMSETGTS